MCMLHFFIVNFAGLIDYVSVIKSHLNIGFVALAPCHIAFCGVFVCFFCFVFFCFLRIGSALMVNGGFFVSYADYAQILMVRFSASRTIPV